MITSPNVITTPTWPQLLRLLVDHDRAAAGEDERERADRLRSQLSQQIAAHAAGGRNGVAVSTCHQQQPALATGSMTRKPLSAGRAVLRALTIAPCIPSATSCVNSTVTPPKPVAPRPARYSFFESAPAMQPTYEPRSARSGGVSRSSATTSLTPTRPPGFNTLAISVSTAALSVGRLITQFEITTSTESAGTGISSIIPSGSARSS